MIEQKKGKIVNISSQAGVFGLEEHSAYSASKGGLNMLTKCMTSEWGRHNIQIKSVCPIVVMTQMGKQVWSDPKVTGPMIDRIPSGRFVETQEVADMVLFLCAPASDMINGQIISVDGGISTSIGLPFFTEEMFEYMEKAVPEGLAKRITPKRH